MSDAARKAREWAEKAETLQQAAQDRSGTPWGRWEVALEMGKLWANVALADATIKDAHEWCVCTEIYSPHCHMCGGPCIILDTY